MIREKSICTIQHVFLLLIVFCLTSCGGGGGGSPTIQTTPAIIPSTTKVLDNTSINETTAISQDGSQITINSTSIQVDSLAVGNIIVSDVSPAAPNGLLKKITNITKTGDKVILQVIDASIEDSIQKGSWNVTQNINSKDTIKAARLAKGVALTSSSSLGEFNISINDVVLYDNDGNFNTSNDQIIAKLERRKRQLS